MSIDSIVKSFIRAIENRQADVLASYLDDKVVFENMPERSIIEGKQAMVEQFKNFFNLTSKIKWNIERELFSETMAVIERKADICFQGKDIVMPMVSVIEVKNGKITLFRDYFDSQTFAKQIG